MIYLFVVLNVLTLGCLLYLARKHVMLLEERDDLTSTIENSLDVMDDAYGKLSKLLEIPVLTDDPIAIEMVETAKYSRDAIHAIAKDIVGENE